LRPDDGGAIVEVVLVRQPAIYLDQDSLAHIARTEDVRRRFLDIWSRRGELLFSWANALDLSGPQGRSAELIKSFLQDLGPHWIPLEMNPWKVVRKENGEEPSSGTPCVSESFLQGYFLRLRDEVTNLGRVVDLIHEDLADWRRDIVRLKSHADSMVNGSRDRYRKDRSSLDRDLPALPNDATRPAAYLLRQLERLTARELGYPWTPNDGIDFLHASVAGSCADFLLLDRQWKRRILAVAPPKTYPWVFYRAELNTFLDAFENIGVGDQNLNLEPQPSHWRRCLTSLRRFAGRLADYVVALGHQGGLVARGVRRFFARRPS